MLSACPSSLAAGMHAHTTHHTPHSHPLTLSPSLTHTRAPPAPQAIQEYCSARPDADDCMGQQAQQQQGPGGGGPAEDDAAPLARPSRLLMLLYSKVAVLAPGSLFYHKYKIKGSPILGRHSAVLLAKNIYSRLHVAIKFYTDARQYEREKAALRLLGSGFVPALEEPVDGCVGL